MSIEEIKQCNIDNAISWIKGNHPEINISDESEMFINFMTKMGKSNDGVFGRRGSPLLNGRDFTELWDEVNQ